MGDSRPIGVFDSGIGGLTVVKALCDLLPNEDIFYLGDTARVPYGPKSPETVQRYAVELAGNFTQKNAEGLVLVWQKGLSAAAPVFKKEIPLHLLLGNHVGGRAPREAARQPPTVRD